MEKKRSPSSCHPERPNAGRGLCSPCYNRSPYKKEAIRKYLLKHPEKRTESLLKYSRSERGAYRQKQYYENNKDMYFGHKLKRKFGITFGEYRKLWESQEGLCLICLNPETREGRSWLCVDHNHTTGLIRGLLCSACNLALGSFRENPKNLKRAIWYVRRFNAGN